MCQLLSPGLLTAVFGGENYCSHFTGEATEGRGHPAVRGRAGFSFLGLDNSKAAAGHMRFVQSPCTSSHILQEMEPVRCLWVQQGAQCLDAMPCAQWGLLLELGMLPGKQASQEPGHCSHCPGLLFVSGSGAPPALAEMRASCLEGRHMAAALIRTLTAASLTGLPTPGSEGEFDTKLKIAAVLFLCCRGGAGRGASAPLNDLPTKNKAFSLHLLCFCSTPPTSPTSPPPPPPPLAEMEPEWWACWPSKGPGPDL